MSRETREDLIRTVAHRIMQEDPNLPEQEALNAAKSLVCSDPFLPMLAGWQRTREAIGRVQCSTPDQLSAAMEVLITEARDLEKVVQEIIRVGLR